jgi:hypothetical protein
MAYPVVGGTRHPLQPEIHVFVGTVATRPAMLKHQDVAGTYLAGFVGVQVGQRLPPAPARKGACTSELGATESGSIAEGSGVCNDQPFTAIVRYCQSVPDSLHPNIKHSYGTLSSKVDFETRDHHQQCHFEIGREKRIYQHLFRPAASARLTDVFPGRVMSVAPEFSRTVTLLSSDGLCEVNPASTNCRVRRQVPICYLLS